MPEQETRQNDEGPRCQTPGFLANGSISLAMAIAALEALHTHGHYLKLDPIILESTAVAWCSPDNRTILIANGDGQERFLERYASSRATVLCKYSREIKTADGTIRGRIGIASADEFEPHPGISELLDDLVELTLDPTLAGAELVVLRSDTRVS